MWLIESARLISHMGSVVEWGHTLGNPHSSYRLDLKVWQVRGWDSEHHLPTMESAREAQHVSGRTGFPSNIHSLDSSHMMLCPVIDTGRPIDLVTVHDCYWTRSRCLPS